MKLFMITILLMISYFVINIIFNPWETKLTLEPQQEPTLIFFYNKLGFMGIKTRQTDVMVNNNLPISILKTNDYGTTWLKIYSGAGRSIPCLSYDRKNNSLYAIILTDKESGGFSSKIIRTTNSGETWETYLNFDDQINGINFENSLMPFMWSTNSIYFINHGKIINLQTEHITTNPIVDNNNNVWVSYNNNTVAKVTKDGSISVWNINKDIQVDAMSWNFLTSELFLVGRSQDGSITRLLKQDGIGKYTEIKQFEALLADAILIQDDVILVLGSSTKHGAFLGMGTRLFISKDSGKSWKKDRNYPAFARMPMFFNSDKTLWINGAMGTIERRKI